MIWYGIEGVSGGCKSHGTGRLGDLDTSQELLLLILQTAAWDLLGGSSGLAIETRGAGYVEQTECD